LGELEALQTELSRAEAKVDSLVITSAEETRLAQEKQRELERVNEEIAAKADASEGKAAARECTIGHLREEVRN